MAPKVEVSDETISRLVKDHLEKQSGDGGVRRHVRRHGMGYAKLAAAITVLATAINGYADLQKETLKLAKENQVLFRAVASKVNGMAERLAYVEGRIEGMKPEEAEEAVETRIKPLEAKPHATATKAKVKGKRISKPPAHNEAAPKIVVMMKDKPPARMPYSLQVKAYEQLPEDLAELIKMEEQTQEQFQDER